MAEPVSWTDLAEAIWDRARPDTAQTDANRALLLLAYVTARKEAERPAHEIEARQNELYLAMSVVEEMPASEAQTACIVKLGDRMRLLVETLGKSEVGRNLQT